MPLGYCIWQYEIKCKFKSQKIRVLILCVEFQELPHLRHDLSQAEEKINVVRSWANAKNYTYFTQNSKKRSSIFLPLCHVKENSIVDCIKLHHDWQKLILYIVSNQTGNDWKWKKDRQRFKRRKRKVWSHYKVLIHQSQVSTI